MKRKVYYLGYYTTDKQYQKRVSPPAAKTKMSYILDVLREKSESVTVLSCADSVEKKILLSGNERVLENVNISYFASVPPKGRILRRICTYIKKLQILGKLVFQFKADDIVIVYHSLFYAGLLQKIFKLRKWKLILEVEEVYSDVIDSEKFRSTEERLFQEADGFICASKMLKESIHTDDRPCLICNGTYAVTRETCEKPRDGKVNVVYAGTLDVRKGAYEAAAAAEYLPENYHVHILGYGGEKEINGIKKHIDDVQSKSIARVSYDGVLQGDDYLHFLQQCEIGLCTQDPDSIFNSTSFPSKILSYLSNGLRVVSIRIPSIEQSAVADVLSFYDRQTPKDIATEIQKTVTSVSPNASCQRLKELDAEFRRDYEALEYKVTSEQGKRNYFLDLLRGFAIILVFAGHCIQYVLSALNLDFFEDPVFRFIYSFHMPLFMLIAGFSFSLSLKKQPNYVSYCLKKCKAMAVTIVCANFFYFFSTSVIRSFFSGTGIPSILNGAWLSNITNHWFLWSYLACIFAMLPVLAFTKKKTLAFLMLLAGIVIVMFFPCAEYSLFMFPYFVLGFLWQNFPFKKIILLCSAICFLLLLPFYGTEHFIYTTGMFGSGASLSMQIPIDLFRYVIGAAGCAFAAVAVFILYMFFSNRKICLWISEIGKRSLQMYIVSTILVSYWLPVCLNALSQWVTIANIIWLYVAALFMSLLFLFLSYQICVWIQKSRLSKYVFGK